MPAPTPAFEIAVLARVPRAGAVKTRLIPALGAWPARVLHEWMARRAVALAAAAAPTTLWLTGPAAHPFAREMALRHGVRVRRQPDGDLGRRMHAAVAAGGAAGHPVLVIGSDCPTLASADLHAAARALAAGHEPVLGPAPDGGYYLIGLARPRAALFEDVGWGGEDVLDTTLRHARALGLDPWLLEARGDVDDVGDLRGLGAVAGFEWFARERGAASLSGAGSRAADPPPAFAGAPRPGHRCR